MKQMVAVIFLVAVSCMRPVAAAEPGETEFSVLSSDVDMTFEAYLRTPEYEINHSVVQLGVTRRTNEYVSLGIRIGKGDEQMNSIVANGVPVAFETKLKRLVGIYGNVYWPVAEYIEPYAVFGFTQIELEDYTNNGLDMKETGRALGVGLSFRFGDMGARIERTNIDGGNVTNSEATTIAVSYSF